MQCQAKSKKTGVQCRRRAVDGKRVCTVHGGLTPGGIASPHFKDGRYSKYLPARLTDKYLEAKSDPALLELRDEIALIDSRLAELLRGIDEGDTRELWEKIQDTFADFEKASIAKDAQAQQVHYLELKRLINAGSNIYTTWEEIYNVIDQRRRTVESERKRLVELQQTITSERAMVLIGALLGIIKQHVTDRAILSAISQDVRAIITVDSGG